MQQQTIFAKFSYDQTVDVDSATLKTNCMESSGLPFFNPPPFDVRNPTSCRNSFPVGAARDFRGILQWVCALGVAS